MIAEKKYSLGRLIGRNTFKIDSFKVYMARNTVQSVMRNI